MNRAYRRIAYSVSRRRTPLASTPTRPSSVGAAAPLLALAISAGAAWLLGGYGAVASAMRRHTGQT